MSGPGESDRGQIEFQSVDSAPKRFAVKLPQWRAPAMLVLFTAISFFLLGLISMPEMRAVFPHHDFVLSAYEGQHAIAVRIFILAFFISFAAFAAAPAWARVLFGIDLVITFAVLCLAYDLVNAMLRHWPGIGYSLHFTEIASGLIGFAVYSMKLLERGRMPSRIPVEHRPIKQRRAFLRLILTIASAAGVSASVGAMQFEIVADMREITLLGGIGPGVFLFLPCLFGQLYLLAIYDHVTAKKVEFRPALTIIVPAHNEEYIIENTIKAMDRAAVHYGGPVHIMILSNNSKDRTAEIAADTIAACKRATGHVLDVPTPGKSHALNAGLEATKTEFLVRVDADTLLGEDNLTLAMRHFADPAVGTVGGVPVPPGGALFDRARLLEVLVKHGFYSVAMASVNGVVGIPGMFVVYRTKQPLYLGGFVEGMNGEDTDISLRIGELGYHSVVDPKIRYVSEVPASYTHMREQRTRWFRSVYHISSRCRDLIYCDWMTLRGKVILPFMLVNSARRAMLVPLLVFGALEYVCAFNPDSPLKWQAIVAVMVGAPAMMAVVAALLNGVPKGILALPEYLLFRVLRSYFTLESMLSISVRDGREHLAIAVLKNIIPNQPVRVA
ncbi:MAG: glycosyltransferase [Pseudomonadota bacterium]